MNKIDLIENQNYFGISAKHGLNLGELLLNCRTIVEKVRLSEKK